MLFILLGIVVVVGITAIVKVYEKYWDYGLTANIYFAQQEAEEGQILTIKEKVENRKKLPLPTLVVKFEMDRSLKAVDKANTSITDKQYRNDSVVIMPYERVTKSIRVVGSKRGFYSIDEIQLVATDLLFRSMLVRRDTNHTWVYVYPSRSKALEISEIYSNLYGEYLTTKLLQEDSMEFKGIRDYAQTDPMQKINWKASAKTGQLKVNQYYDSFSQRLTIFLNVSQSGVLKYYDLIEESIRIARNFMEEFVGKGIPVRFITNGTDILTGEEIYIPEGAGNSHIDTCLKQFAKMNVYAPSRDMAQIIQGYSNRNGQATDEVSILLSAEQNDALMDAYEEYATRNVNANWLIPIHAHTLREKEGRMRQPHNIRTEYLVIEQQEG